MKKRILSMLLAIAMVVGMLPTTAFAATGDNLCDHHTEHTAECGYSKGSAGSACTHEHSEDCYEIVECLHTHSNECDDPCTHECTVENGCITRSLDCHHVHGDCGYSEGTAEVPCGHVHNESCGYAEAAAGTPCANAETDPECDHSGDCGFMAAAEGQPCGHTEHTDCGYAPATEGTPCTHTHAVKVDSADSCYKLLCSHKDGGHDDACGYAQAAPAHECHYECADCAAALTADETTAPSTEATTEPSTEATESAPVCDCGTDDESIHAVGCPVYVAPENPQCFCVETCTALNQWCDVCGFDHTACAASGEEEAVEYEWLSSMSPEALSQYFTLVIDSYELELCVGQEGRLPYTFAWNPSYPDNGMRNLFVVPNPVSSYAEKVDLHFDQWTIRGLKAGEAQFTLQVNNVLTTTAPVNFANFTVKVYDHSYASGSCTRCGYECKAHSYAGGICTICGYECPEHSYADGICSLCGAYIPNAVAVLSKDGEKVFVDTTLDAVITEAEKCTADDKAVVTILQDINLSDGSLRLSSGVFNIDLNGKTLSNTGANTLLILENSVNVTIIDSGTSGTIRSENFQAIILTDSSVLTINGGSIEAPKGVAIISQKPHNGTLTVNGGTISGLKYGIEYLGVGSIVINDGVFRGYNLMGVYITSDSSYGRSRVSVTGGTFIGKNFSLYIAYYVETIAISGGTYDGKILLHSGSGLNAVLVDGYAFWAGDTMLLLADDAMELSGHGLVTVKAACSHKDRTYVNQGENHIWSCADCGNQDVLEGHSCVNLVCPCGAVDVHTFADGVCTICGITGGYCGAEEDGKNLIWLLAGKKLIINGTGAMKAYSPYTVRPWHDYCGTVTSLTISEGVTCIPDHAFFGFSHVTSVTIPASVEELGALAFGFCNTLKEVTFAEGSRLTSIGSEAFSSGAMEQITIPAGVTHMDPDAFRTCNALTEIHVAASNTAYKSENGVVYTADGTTLVFYPAGKKDASFTTPTGVTTIGNQAFESHRYLETIVISEGVTNIGDDAFHSCGQLNTVTIPASVTEIGYGVFDGCGQLYTVNVPCSWESEPLYTFQDSVTVKVAAHTLTYTASGNVITATCSANCGYTGTATISAANTTYDGTEQKTAIVAYSDGWTGGELTITYANNINAGTATASISIGEATASVEFTIAKAQIDMGSLKIPEFAENLVYDGTEKALVTVPGSVNGGTILYSLILDGEYTEALPVATEAGEYKVYWTIQADENHEDILSPGETLVTIEQKELTLKLTSLGKEYDGTNILANYTAEVEGFIIYDEGSYVAPGVLDYDDVYDDVSVDEEKLIVTLPGSAVGTYTTAKVSGITLTGEDAGNYTIATEIDEVPIEGYYGDFEISKAYITISSEDQIVAGENNIDSDAWTVDELPEGHTIHNVALQPDDEDTYILVITDNVGITDADGRDVTDCFEISTDNSGIITRTHEGHSFNADGFCATGQCRLYQAADITTDEWGNAVYEISNAGQLYWFAELVNIDGDRYAGGLLVENIVIPAGAPNWIPIGGYSEWAPYTGNFDGQGHTISGLKCETTGTYAGLFGYTDYANTIQNIGILNSSFKGTQYVGGLIGSGYTTVTNCYVANTTVEGTGSNVGGFMGYNGSYVANCFTNASTLIGSNSGTVENSYYLSDTETEDGGKTAAQFASGEVAWLLQDGIEADGYWDDNDEWIETEAPHIWGQTIGINGYPVLGGAKVYQVLNCKSESDYSNTTENLDHKIENGICSVCGMMDFSNGPVIIQQPTDVETKMGDNFCVTVEAQGEGLKYKWYFRNAGAERWSKSGVTDNTYDDVMTNARTGREIYCVITDANGNSVTSEIAKLTAICTELAITQQPSDASAKLDEEFCVTVEAEGDELKYQWYWRKAGSETWNISGQRDNTYDDVMTSARHNREVYCVITDAWGNKAESDIATITGSVTVPLAITRQPQDQTVKLGDMFNVTFDAQGDGLKYQWYFRKVGTEKWYTSAQKDNSYDDVMTVARHDRELYCLVTDAWGNKVETEPIVTIMASHQYDLAIITQPENASARMDEMFCVIVEAQGDGLKYQWYWRNVGSENWNISGQRDNTYDDVMTKARHNREVKCVITDMWGERVETDVVTITGIPNEVLAIVTQPTDASAAMGEKFCVTVEAQGDGLTYTWYIKNAGSNVWTKSSVRDNTYDDVMTRGRAGREVKCVITDIWGNTVTTETVTLICTDGAQAIAMN